MILSKKNDSGNEVCLYKSSNILKSTYDKSTNNLTVFFKGGGVYTYQGVSESDYVRFTIADSQGKVLNEHIKKYPFVKGDKINDSELTDEVSKLSEAMLNEMGGEVVNDVLDMINSTDRYSIGFLNKIVTRINSGIEYIGGFK